MNQNFEFNINSKYCIISRQTIQTKIPQIINRIEIGRITGETNSFIICDTVNGIRKIKKLNIRRLINLDNIEHYNVLFQFERIEGVLV